MKIIRLTAAIILLLVGAAHAETWPAHNLRIIVPFPAGGSSDTQARVIADELAKRLGKPVVVENKPGAGGNLAATEAAHAAPDGYTLYMATTSTHAIPIDRRTPVRIDGNAAIRMTRDSNSHSFAPIIRAAL